MRSAALRARVRALAKINLDLRVLHRRPDGYHELRTIFQTVSLADTLEISFTPARTTTIQLQSNPDIPDNIVVRAARLALDSMRVTGHVELALHKAVPMGAGLGGGSSDAAAVLLTLPVLAKRRIEQTALIRIAAELGSDVPFFLLGGTAVGIGRGTELYPLPDLPPLPGLILVPDLHVSTAEAYRSLNRPLTTEPLKNNIVSFQSDIWSVSRGRAGEGDLVSWSNDFETEVFKQFPQLSSLKRRLLRVGALPVRMTGSGSGLYGLFRTRGEVDRALKSLKEERVFPISLVSRARYRAMWLRRLQAFTNEDLWPPQSRFAR